MLEVVLLDNLRSGVYVQCRSTTGRGSVGTDGRGTQVPSTVVSISIGTGFFTWLVG